MSGILCLFSAPLLDENKKPIPLLDYESEEEIIKNIFEKGKLKKYKARFATTKEFFKNINKGYDIIHLSGHGNENCIYFEDGKGGAEPLTAENMKEIFKQSKNIKLAVVSACHSEEIGKTLVEAGINRVVAVKTEYSVLDRFATKFFEMFYESLIIDKSNIDEAFDFAKITLKYDSEWMKYKENHSGKKDFFDEDKKYILLPEDRKVNKIEFDFSSEEKEECDSFGVCKNNLTVKRPERFTGRTKEIYEIINILKENRVVTIKGTGGIGKTTLANEIARWFCSRGEFEGIYFVDIREEQNIESIMHKVSSIIEFDFDKENEFFDNIKRCKALFMFDNAEDIVVEKNSEFKDFIEKLTSKTMVKCLITSQRALGGLVGANERTYYLSDMENEETFNLINKILNRDEILQHKKFSEVIELLGGNPLGIRITIENINKGYSIETLIEKMREGIVKDLTDNIENRKNALNISMELAFNMLSLKAKTLLAILSFFPSGILYDLLENIIMEEKIENFIIEFDTYSFLEITNNNRVILQPAVRLFAKSKAVDIVEEYAEKLISIANSYSQIVSSKIMSVENLQMKVVFSVEENNISHILREVTGKEMKKETKEIKADTASRVMWIYNVMDRISSGIDFGNRINKVFQNERNFLGEANVYQRLGDLYVRNSQLKEAEENYNKSLPMYKEIGAKLGEANVYKSLGNLYVRNDKLKEAEENYNKSLPMYKEIGDKLGEANVYKSLGDLYVRNDKLKEAEENYNKSLPMYKEIGAKLREANVYKSLGDLYVRNDKLKEEEENYNKSLPMYKEIGAKLGEANVYKSLGDLYVRNDKLKEAEESYNKSLPMYKEIGAKLGEANVLLRIGIRKHILMEENINEENIGEAEKIYLKIEDSDGMSDVASVKMLIELKYGNNDKADEYFKQCLDIREKCKNYLELLFWFKIYRSFFADKKEELKLKIIERYIDNLEEIIKK